MPWTAISKDPQNFLPAELLPPGPIAWAFPGNMHVNDRRAVLKHWFSVGRVRVLKVKTGNSIVPAEVATAAPAAPGAPGPDSQLAIAGTIVNRYGSRGREVLSASKIQLYDAQEDRITPEVFEDDLIDPVELERTEDDAHSHLAPCVVPRTSEAQAQYCMTALQLVSEGRDKEIALKCVKSLVQLPVRPATPA